MSKERRKMQNKNWTGSKRSPFANLGASNHTREERESNDYYATDPIAAKLLLENEMLYKVWECSCGEGHLAKVFKDAGCLGLATDLIDRGYGTQLDFFDSKTWDGDIVTNPPYKYAQEFIEHALDIIPEGSKVCMFLKIQFLEGQKRKDLFKKYPPKTVYVSSSRILCAMNGEFEKSKGSAVAYAWFVWEKGFKGNPLIKWIN